jgi:hypothetical protein
MLPENTDPIIVSLYVDCNDNNVREDILRSIRNSLLSNSDWTQLPDSPLTEAKRAEWATYRQTLRDITETYAENLLDTEFPNQPEL